MFFLCRRDEEVPKGACWKGTSTCLNSFDNPDENWNTTIGVASESRIWKVLFPFRKSYIKGPKSDNGGRFQKSYFKDPKSDNGGLFRKSYSDDPKSDNGGRFGKSYFEDPKSDNRGRFRKSYFDDPKSDNGGRFQKSYLDYLTKWIRHFENLLDVAFWQSMS